MYKLFWDVHINLGCTNYFGMYKIIWDVQNNLDLYIWDAIMYKIIWPPPKVFLAACILTLSHNYLPSIFEKHYQLLKLLFDSKPVSIIMNEITDDCVWSIINTLFCYHNETKLVLDNFFERVNNTTMGQIFRSEE